MKILGIETSCDETGAAIVENGTKILSNVIASSVELHKKTGGIIPEVAAREQVKCIIPVIEEAIKSAGGAWQIAHGEKTTSQKLRATSQIDALTVTFGPGLIGSLLVGIETAKTLSYLWKKPIVPVNHLLGHIYANWLDKEKLPEFPAVYLVASGGHTELVLMKNHGQYKWLGGTRDDAAGEAFDKIARLLGLGYPGGPAIAAEAAKFKIRNSCLPAGTAKFEIKLPRPMIKKDNLDFSFSGLKTAVLRKVKELKTMKSRLKVEDPRHKMSGQLNNEAIEQLSFEAQEAITDCLVEKTIKATRDYKVKSILLSGGVAANERLREKMQLSIVNYQLSINYFAPLPKLCTDNAAAIASCAFFNFKPVPWQKITTYPSLGIDKGLF